MSKETGKVVPLGLPHSIAKPMTEFEGIVSRCADSGANMVISNGSPVHARFLIMKLFSVARKQVSIYTGTLAQAADGTEIYAWPELIAAARKFLSIEGSELRIVVQDGIDGGNANAFLRSVVCDEKRRGSVAVLVSTQGGMADFDQHFMAVDGAAYRLEVDGRNTAAVGNFGDGKMARRLHSIFDAFGRYLQLSKQTASRKVYVPGDFRLV